MSAAQREQEFDALTRAAAAEETSRMDARHRAIVWRFLVAYIAVVAIGAGLAFL